MCLLDLSVRVLQQVTHTAMEDTRPARRQSRCMLPARYPLPRCFDPDQLYRLVLEKPGKDAHGVRAPADTRHHGARQAADLLEHLRPRLPADHRLEIAHQTGKWVWADHRTDDV